MPFPAAPWVIGPVPIILTVWAAYACGIAVVKQRPTTGEAFLAAFLLPGGLTSIACQLFLSQRNFTALLIGNQFVSSAFFFIVMHASGMRATPDLTSKETLQRAVKSFVILLTSYIVSNLLFWLFPGSDRCTIAKCSVYEWALGRKDHIFSRLYLETLWGVMLLMGIFSILYYAFRKIGRDHFSK
ncbi:hypothetical protein [Rhizobium sp. NXC14]|uniref:hypothetical protein n=1 Tax=Rhizobium sp. NXC14 TaxID=1981173 RepID=UPI000A26ECD0|nr:hypothetical protein [Rhizobium sp. NXC14]